MNKKPNWSGGFAIWERAWLNSHEYELPHIIFDNLQRGKLNSNLRSHLERLYDSRDEAMIDLYEVIDKFKSAVNDLHNWKEEQ